MELLLQFLARYFGVDSNASAHLCFYLDSAFDVGNVEMKRRNSIARY